MKTELQEYGVVARSCDGLLITTSNKQTSSYKNVDCTTTKRPLKLKLSFVRNTIQRGHFLVPLRLKVVVEPLFRSQSLPHNA